MRCLIVEDDARIAADIAQALEQAGFRAEHAADGESAWFMGGTENYALIVLDLGLPRIDGLTVLKRWRSEGVDIPVLVLTARGSWNERVEGIDAGADDYLPKPFRMEELVARARALVRRASGRVNPVQQVGRLALDTNRQTVSIDGRMLNLTQLEFRLISCLVMNAERVVPPVELLEQIYGDDDSRDVNAIEAVIARLRRKTGPGVIGTRRGFGYFLEQSP
ncbi:response regulator transcription factor [Paracoccus sp. PAR01]|uniref:response regulator transcription factor n=1 Tax=Paracoccus sp. PAR01 TaxID=2769282 RepID=UPI0017806F9B|nr:response regulator transcription factor [Paracoccus sp. PAR01]MBD9527756.1 response regulator transcription factor [Paracoccus sp. PAR01]